MEDFKNVETLLNKAAAAEDSGDAMRFSQAAQNAAGALCSLEAVRTKAAETKHWAASLAKIEKTQNPDA